MRTNNTFLCAKNYNLQLCSVLYCTHVFIIIHCGCFDSKSIRSKVQP